MCTEVWKYLCGEVKHCISLKIRWLVDGLRVGVKLLVGMMQ